MAICIEGESTKEVISVQCEIVFELYIEDLAEKLELSEDKIREMWNNEELENHLQEKMSLEEILVMSAEALYGFQVPIEKSKFLEN